MSSYKQRAYIIHHHGSLNNCTPSDPRDLTKRAIEIFRKLVDPENEYLEEEIENLKRQSLKDFIIRKGGTQDDVTAKSKTELRAIGESHSATNSFKELFCSARVTPETSHSATRDGVVRKVPWP